MGATAHKIASEIEKSSLMALEHPEIIDLWSPRT
jgi:hypothetical protein